MAKYWPIVRILRKQKLEDQEFKVILGLLKANLNNIKSTA